MASQALPRVIYSAKPGVIPEYCSVWQNKWYGISGDIENPVKNKV